MRVGSRANTCKLTYIHPFLHYTSMVLPRNGSWCTAEAHQTLKLIESRLPCVWQAKTALERFEFCLVIHKKKIETSHLNEIGYGHQP